MTHLFEEFDPMFANCNNCGDTGVMTKACWCGGSFKPTNVPSSMLSDATIDGPSIAPLEEPINVSFCGSSTITGPKSCADGEVPESRCYTNCGMIDMFHQQSPFACCLCSSGGASVPTPEDEWYGIPIESTSAA